MTNGQSIETTANHPFFVSNPTPEAAAQSVPAGQLAIGNSIVTRAGPSVALAQVEQTHQTKTVYNCTVDDFHTYFVGQDALWVHNVDCFDPIPNGTTIGSNVEIRPRDPVTGAIGETITDLDRIQKSGNEIWVIEEKQPLSPTHQVCLVLKLLKSGLQRTSPRNLIIIGPPYIAVHRICWGLV